MIKIKMITTNSYVVKLGEDQIHHQVGGELSEINRVRNANNFQPQYFDFFNRQGSCRNRNNYPKHIQIRERIT